MLSSKSRGQTIIILIVIIIIIIIIIIIPGLFAFDKKKLKSNKSYSSFQLL
jgi:hypothetical protein